MHCLTSPVALELSANVLLAVGAVPSLTADAASVREFVAATEALVVNLGMLEPARQEAILVAAATAHELGRPWLLDPVKVELSGRRLDFARRLLLLRPALVRGNAAEMAALAGAMRRLRIGAGDGHRGGAHGCAGSRRRRDARWRRSATAAS